MGISGHMNEISDWPAYRTLFTHEARPQGVELAGLSEEEYMAAVVDPRTVLLPDRQTAIPVLTPLENAFWYNSAYYRQALEISGLDASTPLWLYDYHVLLHDANPNKYREAVYPHIGRLAEEGAVIVCDFLDEEADRYNKHLNQLFTALDIGAREIVSVYDVDARHFNHAAVVTLADRGQVRNQPLGIIEAYQLGRRQGAFSDSLSVETCVGEEDREQVWHYYKTAFDGLTANDPMCASSPREEFDMLLTDQDVIKLVERSNGAIASLCMFGDVRGFAWANQTLFQRKFPELYEQGRVFFFPGVIRDPEADGDGRRVMASMGRLLSLAGIERSVLSFVCDKTSEKPVTVIGNWALNHSGVVTDVRQRINERIFTAWALQG